MSCISIVIPTFNRAQLLQRALSSLARQDLRDTEIIVVDDGSTDATESVVKSFGYKIRYERQSRKGPGAARNLGWSLVRSDYVAFLDSDDVWFSWTLETHKSCIEKYKCPKLVIGTYVDFCEEPELAAVPRAPLKAVAYRDYLSSADEFVWMGAGGMLVRRDCQPRFEPEQMNGEDLDLALHLGLEEGFVAIVQPVMFGCRKHQSNLVRNFDQTMHGMRHLIADEKTNKFPGGSARRSDRLKLITRSTRPPTLEALRCGRPFSGFELYWETLGWNAALGRWKFILGFPVLALAAFPKVCLDRFKKRSALSPS
jgi:Glycosyl transferase family 2